MCKHDTQALSPAHLSCDCYTLFINNLTTAFTLNVLVFIGEDHARLTFLASRPETKPQDCDSVDFQSNTTVRQRQKNLNWRWPFYI